MSTTKFVGWKQPRKFGTCYASTMKEHKTVSPRCGNQKQQPSKKLETWKTLSWYEFLGVLCVHEVHLQNRDHLPCKYFATLKSFETSFRKEEKKSSSKALKVHMVESEASDASSGRSRDDEMALMSKISSKCWKRKESFNIIPKTKTLDSRINTRRKTMRSSILNVET